MGQACFPTTHSGALAVTRIGEYAARGPAITSSGFETNPCALPRRVLSTTSESHRARRTTGAKRRRRQFPARLAGGYRPPAAGTAESGCASKVIRRSSETRARTGSSNSQRPENISACKLLEHARPNTRNVQMRRLEGMPPVRHPTGRIVWNRNFHLRPSPYGRTRKTQVRRPSVDGHQGGCICLSIRLPYSTMASFTGVPSPSKTRHLK